MFALLFVAFFSLALCARRPCSGPGAVPCDNLCVGAMDSTTKELTPNCVNVGTLSIPDYQCSRCADNCDCPPGSYCVKAPGPSAGTCATLEAGKLGQPCVVFNSPGTPDARLPRVGIDDALACGKVAFGANGDFEFYEWLGSCAMGICYACSGDAASAAIATAAATVPGLTSAAVPRNATKGNLFCPDRVCYNGAFTATIPPSYWELLPEKGIYSGIFVVLLLGLIMNIVWCFAEQIARRREMRALLTASGPHGATDSHRNGIFEIGDDKEVEVIMAQNQHNA